MRIKRAIKVLIADSDARTLYCLARRLEDDGMKTIHESTGEMAIRSLNTGQFDICLYNTVLPDMSGFDLLKTTRALSPDTKVIMMTSSLVRENINIAMENGAYYFITKPVAPEYIRDIITRALQCKKDVRGRGNTKREFARARSDESIEYTLSIVGKCDKGSSYLGAKCHLKARTLDISEAGVGVVTRFPLEKNQAVVFRGALNNKSGIVCWASMLDEKTCRAGIKFV